MSNSISDEEIRVAAYYLWEKEGRPEGVDFDLWVRAKNELAKKVGNGQKTAEKKAAAPAAVKPVAAAPAAAKPAVAVAAAPAKKATKKKK